MTKPIKPNITIPEAFAVNGQKADFLDEKIQNGFSNVDPDVLAGDNLNKLIDDTYKGLNYSMDGVSDLYKSLITYDSTETYGLNSIVFNIEEEGVALYQSLIADNTGNALTDEAKWKKLELGGGGAGQPIGSLFWSFATADYVPDYALSCDGTEYSSAMFTGLWNNYLAADVPKLKVLLLLPVALLGRHTGFRGVTLRRGSRIRVRSEKPLPIHTDGEPLFLRREAEAYTGEEKIRVITG